MKRRTWDSKSKARIVLEGLQGRSGVSICSEYQITQGMYYILYTYIPLRSLNLGVEKANKFLPLLLFL